MTITKTLFDYFDSLSECIISGWDLFEEIRTRTGKNTYPSTLLKMAREYADISGADFICIDTKKSIYKFKPCIRLGNAIIRGKE